jgi:predicted ArsR family transcriptional regulator
MDFFDERVLATLKDSKPRNFTALLGEVGFSQNTPRHHLERLAAQGFVVMKKAASDSYGRLRFAYQVPSRTKKAGHYRTRGPVHGSRAPAVQSPETRLQVREGWPLQRNKKKGSALKKTTVCF